MQHQGVGRSSLDCGRHLPHLLSTELHIPARFLATATFPEVLHWRSTCCISFPLKTPSNTHASQGPSKVPGDLEGHLKTLTMSSWPLQSLAGAQQGTPTWAAWAGLPTLGFPAFSWAFTSLYMNSKPKYSLLLFSAFLPPQPFLECVCEGAHPSSWSSIPKFISILNLAFSVLRDVPQHMKLFSRNKMLFIRHSANHWVKFFPHDSSFSPRNEICADSISLLQLRKLSHRVIT